MPLILGIIPARGGSKGIPKKNIALLAGRLLIEYTFDAAKGSKLIDRLILTTDDEEIAEVGRKNGIEIPFIRPKELAADDTPTLPVIKHAVNFMENEFKYMPDMIVILQPTAPLRKARHIDEALNLLINSDADSIVSVVEVPHQYNPYFIMEITDGKLSFYRKEGLNFTRRQDLPKVYARNGAIYALRKRTFSQNKSLYGNFCLPYIMKFEESINIDSIYDLKIAEMFIRERL